MPATATTPAKKVSQRPRRKPLDGPVWYVVAIESWEWSLSFGIDRTRNASEPYTDFRHLHLIGKLLRPTKLKEDTVRVVLLPDERYNRDHWDQQRHVPSIGGIGFYRGSFEALCLLPADALPSLLTMLTAEKLRYVVLQGAKLRYGRAHLEHYSLEMTFDDDLPPE
jgi:hypothetical protein